MAASGTPSKKSWQYDDTKVELYFKAVHENFKGWLGEAPQQIKLKLYAVYKQATVGDCNEERPFDSYKRKKWEMWKLFAGMERLPAMRRYMTLLHQLDPQLLVVEVQERPPPLFPATPMGEPICARCNCVAGCISPLISRGRQPKYKGEHMKNGGHDPYAIPLEERLLTDPSLLSYHALKEWMLEEGARVRCKFGAHTPITEDESRPFHQWFDHVSCGGFQSYDHSKDKTLAKIVEGLLTRAFHKAFVMQTSPKDYRYEERVEHVQKCIAARKALYDVTGHYFTLQVECQRFDSSHCNAKRVADGFKNHLHPLELESPEPDYADYALMSGLRKELNRIGVDPTTNIVASKEDREDRLGLRLAKHQTIEFTVKEAQRRQRARNFYGPIQRKRMLDAGAEKTARQLRNAIRDNNAELCVALVRRGAPTEVEAVGGLTAIIRATLNGDRSFLRMLHEAGADVNAYSHEIGFNALCWACRRGDLRMVEALLDLPDIVVSGEGPTGWTPLLTCAAAGQTKCCDALLNWVKEHGAGGDETAKEVAKFVNFQNIHGGDTALHVAARARQLPMCMHLLEFGARKYTRNGEGRDAAALAADCGFHDLATWLDGTRLGAETDNTPKLDILLELQEKREKEAIVAAELERVERLHAVHSSPTSSRPTTRGSEGRSRPGTRGGGDTRNEEDDARGERGGGAKEKQKIEKMSERQQKKEHAAVVARAKAKFEAQAKVDAEEADGEALRRAEQAASLMVVALRLGLRKGPKHKGEQVLERHRHALLQSSSSSSGGGSVSSSSFRSFDGFGGGGGEGGGGGHGIRASMAAAKSAASAAHKSVDLSSAAAASALSAAAATAALAAASGPEPSRKFSEFGRSGIQFVQEGSSDDYDDGQGAGAAASVAPQEGEEEAAGGGPHKLSPAEVEARNQAGREALRRLAKGEDPLSGGVDQFDANEKHLLVAVDLIEHEGCPPNFETPEGATALLVASFAGDAHAVRRLIAQGCDASYQNRNGRTPLMAAAAGGSVEVSLALIRAGAQVNGIDLEGKTAGQFAFEAGMAPLSRLLVNIAKVGLEQTLTLLQSDTHDTAFDHLMTEYGMTPGDVGGPDDPTGDSFLWRLPIGDRDDSSANAREKHEDLEEEDDYPNDQSDMTEGPRLQLQLGSNGGGSGGGGGGCPSTRSSSVNDFGDGSSSVVSDGISPRGGGRMVDRFSGGHPAHSGAPGAGGGGGGGVAMTPSMATIQSTSSTSSSSASASAETFPPQPPAADNNNNVLEITNGGLGGGNGSGGDAEQRHFEEARAAAAAAASAAVEKRKGEKLSEEELQEALLEVSRLREAVKAQGRRLTVARPNSPERRYLDRIKAASTLKNKKQVKDVSKAAAAKKKLKDSSLFALEQVQELARTVTFRASEGDSAYLEGQPPPPPPIVGDGIEQWKDRMDEAKRRWVQGEVVTADVVAARKRPEYFVKPAELEMAFFLIGQKKFAEAEEMLLETRELQKKAELRDSGLAGGKFAVGLCLRGLAAVSEAKGKIPKALKQREESLALIATALEPTDAEVRVAVDLVAGTHMLLRNWSLAVELYTTIATDMSASEREAARTVGMVMEQRAAAVGQVRDRADMAANDLLSTKAEMLFRHPEMREAMRIGKTLEFLEALMVEDSWVSAAGRFSFKRHVHDKGGALPDLFAFFMEVQRFRIIHKDGEGPEFAQTLRRINKKYIKPRSKLPMLTQGIRADIEDDMRDPSVIMFNAAQKLVLHTLFAASFGGSDPWIATEDGQTWKRTRDLMNNPRSMNAIQTLQVVTRFVLRRKQAKEAQALAESGAGGSKQNSRARTKTRKRSVHLFISLPEAQHDALRGVPRSPRGAPPKSPGSPGTPKSPVQAAPPSPKPSLPLLK